MSWIHLSAAQVAPSPWRNGGGQTRELLAWPHAQDWTLRISVADITADGPFSSFPGVDRWFAVLSGDGVDLQGQVLRPGDPVFAFDGERAPGCRLLGGATQDFNAMHRRGAGRFELRPATEALVPRCDWLGLFTEEGGSLNHGGRARALPPRTLAWCEKPAAQPCRFASTHGRGGPGAAWWLIWSET
ncbi:HutD family protein [Pelomonas sp. CA6]|uniref:HutD/Ves family protein n=1 Tax=Pelomonas sp. CA6 TaxID=2907999 RepID=UPI001F4C06AB|nr:HutD family protein [Pelomonas sp. CA6]MCH7343741.1 HutD family protein [Pelomonas sp. CA6]